jgi:hypothetical protein
MTVLPSQWPAAGMEAQWLDQGTVGVKEYFAINFTLTSHTSFVK